MNFNASVNNQIFRKDWPVILALNAHLATILPVLLKFSSTDLLAGQVLAPDNSSPPIYAAYSAVSGSFSAACILMDTITADQFTAPTGLSLGRGIFGGEVYKNNLIDANATALGSSGLGGKTITDANNVPIYKF